MRPSCQGVAEQLLRLRDPVDDGVVVKTEPPGRRSVVGSLGEEDAKRGDQAATLVVCDRQGAEVGPHEAPAGLDVRGAQRSQVDVRVLGHTAPWALAELGDPGRLERLAVTGTKAGQAPAGPAEPGPQSSAHGWRDVGLGSGPEPDPRRLVVDGHPEPSIRAARVGQRARRRARAARRSSPCQAAPSGRPPGARRPGRIRGVCSRRRGRPDRPSAPRGRARPASPRPAGPVASPRRGTPWWLGRTVDQPTRTGRAIRRRPLPSHPPRRRGAQPAPSRCATSGHDRRGRPRSNDASGMR